MSRMRVAALAAMMGGLAIAVSPAEAAAPTIGVGSNPNAIAVSSAQARAYVANDGSVSVVDLNTHQQLAEISTTVNHGQNAIGLYRAGNKAYIGDFGLNTMVAFDTTTQSVTPGIRIGFGVTGFAGAGNGFAYVSRFGKQGATGSIRIVDVGTNAIVKTIRLTHGAGTLTTAPLRKRIWVGSVNSGLIWVLDTATNTIVRRVKVLRSGPVQGIAFTPNRKQAWVSGLGGITVINRATGKASAFIPTNDVFPPTPTFTPGPIVMNRSGSEALVLNTASPDPPLQGSVVAIDTATMQRTSSTLVGNGPTAFAIDRSTNLLLTTNFPDDTLSYFTAPG